MPKQLPVSRCALTAPFHPYPFPKAVGGLLSVALSSPHGARPLAGSMFCGVPTFLTFRREGLKHLDA